MYKHLKHCLVWDEHDIGASGVCYLSVCSCIEETFPGHQGNLLAMGFEAGHFANWDSIVLTVALGDRGNVLQGPLSMGHNE